MTGSLIHFAMMLEAKPFLDLAGAIEVEDFPYGRLFELSAYPGSYATVSGIGKAKASGAVTAALVRTEATWLFSFGISGAVSGDVGLGDLVVGSAAVEHDFDLRPMEQRRGVGHGEATHTRPHSGVAAELLDRLSRAQLPLWQREVADRFDVTPAIHSGVVASGDQLITSQRAKDEIAMYFPEALCVDMESAAIASAIARSSIHFGSVRVISDSADERFDASTVLDFCRTHGAHLLAVIAGEAILAAERRWPQAASS